MNIKNALSKAHEVIKKHAPQILTAVGLVGFATTCVLVAKETPKAEEKKEALGEDARVIDKVKAVGTVYLPAVAVGTASAACILSGNSIQMKRTAALAAAYKITDESYQLYKEKIREQIGEKKEQAVQDDVAKDILVKHPVKDDEIIQTYRGETLCYDAVTGRYFRSDIEKVKRAFNLVNERMFRESYASLNDLQDEFGMGSTKLGDMIGWTPETGLVDPHFSSQLASNGEPTLVISYDVHPGYGFR